MSGRLAALDTLSRECFRSFARLPGAALVDDGRVFGVHTRVPLTFFNGIATSRVDPDDVLALVGWFARPFRWWISPSTEPASLPRILEACGMRHAFDSTGMTCDLTRLGDDDPLPRGVEIVRVTGSDAMREWAEVFIPGFGRPPEETATWLDAYAQCGEEWVHFVARLEGVPVGTTSLLMAGRLAGIYHVLTRADARGRGIGAAVTRAAMLHARDAGATLAALQSSEMGLPVYRRLGFEPHCRLQLWHRFP